MHRQMQRPHTVPQPLSWRDPSHSRQVATCHHATLGLSPRHQHAHTSCSDQARHTHTKRDRSITAHSEDFDCRDTQSRVAALGPCRPARRACAALSALRRSRRPSCPSRSAGARRCGRTGSRRPCSAAQSRRPSSRCRLQAWLCVCVWQFVVYRCLTMRVGVSVGAHMGSLQELGSRTHTQDTQRLLARHTARPPPDLGRCRASRLPKARPRVRPRDHPSRPRAAAGCARRVPRRRAPPPAAAALPGRRPAPAPCGQRSWA
jgi:hypothetical protein